MRGVSGLPFIEEVPMEVALVHKKCQSCEDGSGKLSEAQVAGLLRQVPEWRDANNELRREFKFKNYHETMAFVNATAWVSHRENHHPDMEVGYNKVVMRYSTHSAGGLTENDFICAAKVDALVA
jgi:4a-hydroxytetrahydrobiopterin dehydratase